MNDNGNNIIADDITYSDSDIKSESGILFSNFLFEKVKIYNFNVQKWVAVNIIFAEIFSTLNCGWFLWTFAHIIDNVIYWTSNLRLFRFSSHFISRNMFVTYNFSFYKDIVSKWLMYKKGVHILWNVLFSNNNVPYTLLPTRINDFGGSFSSKHIAWHKHIITYRVCWNFSKPHYIIHYLMW